MALLDLSALTINEEEASQLSQAIFEATITGGDLSEYHDIVTGVHHKQQIPFIGNMELVGKTQTGCSRTESTETIPFTEKFWDPTLIGDRLKHCATDVNQLFKLFKKASKVNPDFYDRIGSEAESVGSVYRLNHNQDGPSRHSGTRHASFQLAAANEMTKLDCHAQKVRLEHQTCLQTHPGSGSLHQADSSGVIGMDKVVSNRQIFL